MDIKFTGWVLPKHMRVTLDKSHTLTWNGVNGVSCPCLVSIRENQVMVECRVPDLNDHLLWDLRTGAHIFAQNVVSMLTFMRGRHFTVVLDDLEYGDGRHGPIWIGSDDLGSMCLVASLDSQGNMQGVTEAMAVVTQNIDSMLAFNDLTDCLARPDLTAINCRRMVDALKHLVGAPEKGDEKLWDKFHAALNLDRFFVQRIMHESKKPRHGQRQYLDRHKQADLWRRGWLIMSRFIEYKKRGGVDLPRDEFSLLEGEPADKALVTGRRSR